MSQRPLYTSPALQYLDSIIQPDWRVFEYGSGGSTSYYKERCAEVRAVEHSARYAHDVRHRVGDHVVRLIEAGSTIPAAAALATDQFWVQGWDLPVHESAQQTEYHGMDCDSYQGYAAEIYQYPAGYFDLVVVDGMARSLCLWHAVHRVNPEGWIIMDNSCRWQYNDAQQWAISQGWRRRDFWQPGHPGYCTSFYSRSFENNDDQPRTREQGDLYHAMGW